MRTTQLTAAIAASLLAAGLTACAPAAVEVEVETEPTEAAVVEEEAPQGKNTWSVEVMTADLFTELTPEEEAAYTALSERLDAAAPSSLGVGVTATYFYPGEVTAQVIVKDKDSMIPGDEVRAILAELKAFTGATVTEWTVESKEMVDGTWVYFDDVADEIGLPAEMRGNWGDLTFTPEQLAAFN